MMFDGTSPRNIGNVFVSIELASQRSLISMDHQCCYWLSVDLVTRITAEVQSKLDKVS